MNFLRLKSLSFLLVALSNERLIGADEHVHVRRQFDLSQFGGMNLANLAGPGGGFGSSGSPASFGNNFKDLPSAPGGEKTNAGTGDSSAGCKAYHLLGARGTSEMSGSIAYNGLEQKVLEAIPGGMKEELQSSSAGDYTVGVAMEAEAAIKMINAQLAKCPKTLYVLVGYSRGAMVQTQILTSLKIPVANIAAVVMFGNPYFRAGLPQNKCDAKSGAGVAVAISPKLPESLVDLVCDCCAAGDMICQTVGSMVTHLEYGDKFGNLTSEFVIQKLKAKLAVTHEKS
ncbi:hypothetical protein PGT21_026200 [Puccinia graminis f. sp. tritici]|uniref:Cutinase n=2 Tax=Puccinia graminis f. sp. tritici TaxID=56615 RepID=A0A5B0S9Z9_PUCGR|nr:hypothetical protein PGT21_026200 [Puccinia graminis f. sp. tritici]KAA1135021.1 hypothetical protein PGTUg99_010180 [Puccinia graminis f. sp. tritici]